MARATIYARIVREIAKHPDGVIAEDIATALGEPIPVIQMYCSKMHSQGMIGRLRTKHTRYKTVAKHYFAYVSVD